MLLALYLAPNRMLTTMFVLELYAQLTVTHPSTPVLLEPLLHVYFQSDSIIM